MVQPIKKKRERKVDTSGTVLVTAVNGSPIGGTVGQILTKNSSANYDMSWAAASGGGEASAKVKLATLSGASASYDFTSIDQTYTDLELVVSGGGTSTTEFDFLLLQFNGDSGSNYSWVHQRLLTTDAVPDATVPGTVTSMPVGVQRGQTNVRQSSSKIEIFSYLDNTHYRNVMGRGMMLASSLANSGMYLFQGHWRNSADAINQITVFPAAGAFDDASKAVLYGIT